MNRTYAPVEPTREEIDQTAQPTVLEFGAPWCGICAAAQPAIAAALDQHPTLRHIKIADGKGRLLGRTFGVKLWPTLIFLRDGREVERLIRPASAGPIAAAAARLAGGTRKAA